MAASYVPLLLAPTAPWLLKPEGMFLIARVVGIATRNLADECSEKNTLLGIQVMEVMIEWWQTRWFLGRPRGSPNCGKF